jgi:hypothetical protein
MKKWTVMVYLAGDNNLSEDMISSLKGMRDVMRQEGSDEQVNLVAIYDSGYPTVETKFYNFTQQNSLLPTLVEMEPKELPSGLKGRQKEIAYIGHFAEYVIGHSDFKAENYALIMSGHSDGFLGKTMFRDNDSKVEMSLEHLGNILSDSKTELRKGKILSADKKLFSVIGFDSCMMGMLEVGFELKDIADLMVASQGYSPTDGWKYEVILKDLIDSKGEKTPEEFAQSIVNNQISFSLDYNVGGRSMCLNYVNLNQADDLRTAVSGLAKVFNEILDTPFAGDPKVDKRTAVIKEYVKNLIHDSHYLSQTYLHEQAVDILDFVKNLSANCDLKLEELTILAGELSVDSLSHAGVFRGKVALITAACKTVETAFANYLGLNRFTGPDYQFSQGVSIFFPWTLLSYNMVYGKYHELKFAPQNTRSNRSSRSLTVLSKEEKTEWVKFIENYTKQTLRANKQPRFTDGTDYLEWLKNVAQSNEAEVGRADTARADTAKADTAKGDQDNFYKLFRRFRNHPIHHDVSSFKL